MPGGTSDTIPMWVCGSAAAIKFCVKSGLHGEWPISASTREAARETWQPSIVATCRPSGFVFRGGRCVGQPSGPERTSVVHGVYWRRLPGSASENLIAVPVHVTDAKQFLATSFLRKTRIGGNGSPSFRACRPARRRPSSRLDQGPAFCALFRPRTLAPNETAIRSPA